MKHRLVPVALAALMVISVLIACGSFDDRSPTLDSINSAIYKQTH